jgi:hypothetical protein
MRFWFGGPRVGGFGAGVSFDLDAFFRRLRRTVSGNGGVNGSFVYVICGDHGMSKIGVSTDPNSRIAGLQTGSPFPLKFEYIGMTAGDGYDIEAAAHELLDRHRGSGEWFSVPPEMAVAAVSAAAHKLGYALTPIPQSRIQEAMRSVRPAEGRYNKSKMSLSGRTIEFVYVALWILIGTVYSDHVLSIVIIGLIVGMAIVNPITRRFFPATVS